MSDTARRLLEKAVRTCVGLVRDAAGLHQEPQIAVKLACDIDVELPHRGHFAGLACMLPTG